MSESDENGALTPSADGTTVPPANSVRTSRAAHTGVGSRPTVIAAVVGAVAPWPAAGVGYAILAQVPMQVLFYTWIIVVPGAVLVCGGLWALGAVVLRTAGVPRRVAVLALAMGSLAGTLLLVVTDMMIFGTHGETGTAGIPLKAPPQAWIERGVVLSLAGAVACGYVAHKRRRGGDAVGRAVVGGALALLVLRTFVLVDDAERWAIGARLGVNEEFVVLDGGGWDPQGVEVDTDAPSGLADLHYRNAAGATVEVRTTESDPYAACNGEVEVAGKVECEEHGDLMVERRTNRDADGEVISRSEEVYTTLPDGTVAVVLNASGADPLDAAGHLRPGTPADREEILDVVAPQLDRSNY